MADDRLRLDALTALARHAADAAGLSARFGDESGGGRRAIFTPPAGDRADDESADALFGWIPPDGGYLSLSLALALDDAFGRDHLVAILDALARYDVGISLTRPAELPEGEALLTLSVRLFGAAAIAEGFALAVENLKAAREALGEAFP